jgi:hypothetical protein
MMNDGDALENKVVQWIERHVGQVRSIVRQGRWRPAGVGLD